ncbi:hypothetical protein [Thermococcus sp. JCM 11816]|uniref:hypothetical protein n=1 Tax=Thermococcus sp. (strain JCM 11816 / KS-1) TaxID=1295125 RepID=UPI003467C844
MLYPASSEKLEKLEIDRIIRISYDRNKLYKWKKEGIIVGGELKEVWDKTSRKKAGWAVQKTFTPSAYSIYAMDPRYYTRELGFVTASHNSTSEKDQPKKESSKTKDMSEDPKKKTEGGEIISKEGGNKLIQASLDYWGG